MIVMGVGPFLGSYIGSWLKDVSGKYTLSICFALSAFLASVFLSTSMPLKAETKQR
jgi:predicted MFS family arabinose efflux permease